MVYSMLIGAGLQLAGSYFGNSAAKKAEAANRARAEAENKRRRDMIESASSQSARGFEQAAGALQQQARGLERIGNYRDPLVEQGLTAGLRAQAVGAAAQSRAEGGGTSDRAAIASQLMQGQGLLAAESHRTQRFAQMSSMAADLRSKSAQVMGQASQARMDGAMAMSNITYNGPQESGSSALAVGLGALGGAIGGMSDSDLGFGGGSGGLQMPGNTPAGASGLSAGMANATRSPGGFNPLVSAPNLGVGLRPTIPGGSLLGSNSTGGSWLSSLFG